MAHHGCQSTEDKDEDLRIVPPQRRDDQVVQNDVLYMKKVELMHQEVLDERDPLLEDQEKQQEVLDERDPLLEDQEKQQEVLDERDPLLEDQEKQQEVLDERDPLLEDQEKQQQVLDERDPLLEDQEKQQEVLDERMPQLEDQDNHHYGSIQYQQHHDLHQSNLQQDHQMVIVPIEPQQCNCNNTSHGERAMNNNRRWWTWLRKFERHWIVRLIIIIVVVILTVIGVTSLVISLSNQKMMLAMARKDVYAHVNVLLPTINATGCKDNNATKDNEATKDNNATEDKVPEFPNRRIYVTFKQGELRSDIEVLEDRVIIIKPGKYLVYSSINFRPDSLLHCKDFKKQNWDAHIEINSNPGYKLIRSAVTCSPETAEYDETSSTSGIHELKVGDSVRISISGCGLGLSKTHSSYLGLFKLTD